MSSTGSPTLTIDVAARRGERWLAAMVVLLVLAATSQLQRPLSAIAVVALCALISVGGAFLLIGWIAGESRIARIACQSDGHWQLCDTRGRALDCELSAATRIGSHALWLQWRGRRLRPLLLLPGDIPASDFRRLVVRLRLLRIANTDESDAT